MKLPAVEQPGRYAGLYVYDFGEWTAVGYTASEIAVLLESEEYTQGQVYRIERVSPDGQMELRGISRERFQLESGMFFNRNELDAARTDFADLVRASEATPPPTRAFVHLADRGPEVDRARYVVALIYPAEHDDDMARWLLDVKYAGGDLVEGGISHVSNYYGETHELLERQQVWSSDSIQSRGAEEVLRSVRRAVQR